MCLLVLFWIWFWGLCFGFVGVYVRGVVDLVGWFVGLLFYGWVVNDYLDVCGLLCGCVVTVVAVLLGCWFGLGGFSWVGC